MNSRKLSAFLVAAEFLTLSPPRAEIKPSRDFLIKQGAAASALGKFTLPAKI